MSYLVAPATNTPPLATLRRHIALATMVGSLLTATLVPAMAFAGGPLKGDTQSDGHFVLTVTPEMQVVLDKKMQAFRAVAASVASVKAGGAMPASIPSSYVLAMYARHQHLWFYCGPATVQVVSNYTWHYYYTSTSGQAPTTNKYTQSKISHDWTLTDTNGQQTSPTLIAPALNAASVLPFAGFYQVWKYPVWSDFQNAIATDTSQWNMPLAEHVNPRSLNSSYILASWPSGQQRSDYGHYIPLRGYSGFTQTSALAYYDDSSGGVDDNGQGMLGSTGAFSDKSETVWGAMTIKAGNFYW